MAPGLPTVSKQARALIGPGFLTRKGREMSTFLKRSGDFGSHSCSPSLLVCQGSAHVRAADPSPICQAAADGCWGGGSVLSWHQRFLLWRTKPAMSLPVFTQRVWEILRRVNTDLWVTLQRGPNRDGRRRRRAKKDRRQRHPQLYRFAIPAPYTSSDDRFSFCS